MDEVKDVGVLLQRGKNMEAKLSAAGTYRTGKLRLPPGYYIQWDAELLTLHRRDGSVVGAFGARVAPAEVTRTVEEDYRAQGTSRA